MLTRAEIQSAPVFRWPRLIGTLALIFSLLAAAWPTAAHPSEARAMYIVQLADAPLASYRGGIAGLAPTNPASRGEVKLNLDSPASKAYLAYLDQQHAAALTLIQQALGGESQVRFAYRYAFNGLAISLSEAEAVTVARLPGVRDVDRDFERRILTDAGPAWIGAPAIWSGEATGAGSATKGEGVVVGVIDTGVNHDHPSFADSGGDGFDHSNPRGQFFGQCDPMTGAPFCNDKLIGVYDFTGTTPLDDNGHGSHTASTAAGNVVQATVQAPTIELTRDISGVAPHANLMTYKACLAIASCAGVSLVAAIDQATADGVDVINYSIGGGSSDPWEDADALAFLGARDAGVFVATSAGNSGPQPGTVGSPADAPWLMAVGASTHNRKLVNSLVNMTGGESPLADIAGESLTSGYGPAAIVHAGSKGDALCLQPFPPGTFDGEIVVCDRGINPRVEKGRNVQIGGAGGFVLANAAADGESTVADAHVLPAVHVGFLAGEELRAWLGSGSGHTATIAGTTADEASVNGDIMAGFSSRGPNPALPPIVKPDVTAPGLGILAAINTTDPTAPPEYGLLSGTSMSSPHAAGAAALVRAVHPEWTAAEVQSALMSTAQTAGVRKEDGVRPADPFDYGGGRIDLRRAALAGLVLDESGEHFLAADPDPEQPLVGSPPSPGDPTTLNLASLANPDCSERCSWTRAVKNALPTTSNWKVSIKAPSGLELSVEPQTFRLAPGATQTLNIVADASRLPLSNWVFAEIQFTERMGRAPTAHFPVAVLAQSPTPIRVTTTAMTGQQTVKVLAEADANNLTARVSGLQEGKVDRQIVEQDPTPLDRYDAPVGTRFFLVDVPEGARLLTANTRGTSPRAVRDIDLLVGRDDDGDGAPGAAEELCASTTAGPDETCTLRFPAAGSYWVMVQTWLTGVADPTIEWVAGVIPGTDNGNLAVSAPRSVSAGQEFDVSLSWNEPALEPGDAWFALIELGSDTRRPADVGALLVDLRRSQ